MIQRASPCFPLAACSCMNHFCFTLKLFWALPSLLEGFSDITQGIVGISGFMIILCPSVIEAIPVNAQLQANNCLSNTVRAAASWNLLAPNPCGHCWEVLLGFCHKLQSAEDDGRHSQNQVGVRVIRAQRH